MKRLFILSVSIGFCFLSACDNEDKPQTFSFSYEKLSSGKLFVLLSGGDGTVYSWEEITPENTNATLTCPPGARPMVTFVRFGPGTSPWYIIHSYADVAAGDYFSKPLGWPNNPGVLMGYHTLSISDPSSYSGFLVGGANLCGSFGDLTPYQWQLGFCGAPTSIYAWFRKAQDIPRFLYIANAAISGTTEVNASTYDQLPVMKSRTYTLSQSGAWQSYVEGFLPNGPRIQMSQAFHFSGSTASVYYPEIPDMIPGFATWFTHRFSNEHAVSFRKEGEVPATFVEPASTVTQMVSKTTQKIALNLAGSASYVRAYLRHESATGSTGPVVDWTVYAPYSATLEAILPQFPTDFLSQADLSFLSDKSFRQFDLVENGETPAWDQFIEKMLKYDGTPVWWKDLKVRSYGYNLPQNSAVEFPFLYYTISPL